MGTDIIAVTEYSRHKGLNNKTCETLIIESLKDHGKLTRKDIDELLWNALSSSPILRMKVGASPQGKTTTACR